ncbi:MAG TPA: hypothetical protein VFN52_02125, partial [Acidiferrobacteraceae bacterium]|nr:hypothetical protein [Acidiferrobacteraceae bacterium]
VQVGPIAVPDLAERAEEVFLTSSLIGIWPVANVEGRRYPVGLFTRCLLEELRRQAILVSDD